MADLWVSHHHRGHGKVSEVSMSQMDYLRMLSLAMIVGGLLMYEYGGNLGRRLIGKILIAFGIGSLVGSYLTFM